MQTNEGKTVIAMLGAPHSGKSVFVAELYRQALANPEIGSKIFLQRACPDGEGMWSAEADQEVVKQLRQKGTFNPETINFYLSSIDGLRKSKDITLIDCGGLKSLENILLLAKCTDAIILSSNEEKLAQWSNFCNQLDEIVNAIKSKDIERLTQFQKEKTVEIIPESKMDQFPDEELLTAEVKKRIETLFENFTPALESVESNKLNIMAQLGSRLLAEEQRHELDRQTKSSTPVASELKSHVDTSSMPWQGEMVDLDRDRPNVAYTEAMSGMVGGLSELNQERLAETKRETEPSPNRIS